MLVNTYLNQIRNVLIYSYFFTSIYLSHYVKELSAFIKNNERQE